MKKILPLLLVIGLIAISSCKKPAAGTGSLKMQLNPMFGGVPMKLGSTYQSPDGKYYFFWDFDMYLSHIKLIHSDGSMVEVNPVTLIMLDDSTNLNPIIPLTNITGTFTGIQFNIGLDSVQDNSPISTDPSSPYNGFMYWPTNNLKYVFVMLTGLADSTNPPTHGIGYHVGTNAYYTTVTLNKPFTLTTSSQTTLSLNMDLQRLFYGGSDPINILAGASEDLTSTSPVPALCQQFITNMDSTFSLR